jgi:hypothetical protein
MGDGSLRRSAAAAAVACALCAQSAARAATMPVHGAWGEIGAVSADAETTAPTRFDLDSIFLPDPVERAAARVEPAAPEPDEPLPSKFMLRAGALILAHIDTTVRLDAVNAPIGTTIDFNKTLGGDDKATSARIDGIYRFNDNHAIGASWYKIRLKGERTIDRDIEWDGVTYPINATVDSFLNEDIWKLNYRYSLYHNQDVEMGVSAGFHVTRVGIGLSAASVGAKNESVTAPLPVFGGFASYNFTPRFSLTGGYEFFFLNFDNVGGSLQDLLVGLEYRVLTNLSVGGAFNLYSLQARYDSSKFNFSLDQTWSGLMAYIAFYF